MKKIAFWRKIALLIIVLMVLGIFGHMYLLYSGPFDAAVAGYRKRFIGSNPEKIELCLTCRKRVSLGTGFRRFRFTVKVTEVSRVQYFEVIDTFNTNTKKHEVVFTKQ